MLYHFVLLIHTKSQKSSAQYLFSYQKHGKPEVPWRPQPCAKHVPSENVSLRTIDHLSCAVYPFSRLADGGEAHITRGNNMKQPFLSIFQVGKTYLTQPGTFSLEISRLSISFQLKTSRDAFWPCRAATSLASMDASREWRMQLAPIMPQFNTWRTSWRHRNREAVGPKNVGKEWKKKWRWMEPFLKWICTWSSPKDVGIEKEEQKRKEKGSLTHSN